MLNLLKKSIAEVSKGSKWYYLWVGFLTILIIAGIGAYIQQARYGLIVTSMRDQVSWGLYISNFTFLVGVAAAAVLLVIPAYLYHFKPIKEIAIFGELMAVTALIMCLLFIVADMGKPIEGWHILPIVGKMNWPASMLTWDVIVLNGYLLINGTAVGYVLYNKYKGREYKMSILWPIILISIPWAVSIHTVTAFLYSGLAARPFWHHAILAPRFIASAMCSGPALMLIVFQIARKVSNIDVTDRAIFKIAELMAYAMGVNLFLFVAEFVTEMYADTAHTHTLHYLYFGLGEHTEMVIPMWSAFIMNFTAFMILMQPKLREKYPTLNVACVLMILGVSIEKGMGLVVPGFIPGALGEVYSYTASIYEKLVMIGIYAIGALFYTVAMKVAIPIYKGEIRETSV